MARDYKNSGGRGKGSGRPLGSWASFVSGLSVGLVVALVLYLWGDEIADLGERRRAATPATAVPGEGPAEPAIIPETWPETPSASPAPEPLDALPKPKFDFYKILPEIEVKVPESELNATGNRGEEQPGAASNSGAYVLQVGSFQRFQDADQAKAQLALQGIQASIQRVVINGQDVWYRVHIGPYQQMAEVQAMRAKLVQAGANFILLRIGDPE